MLRIFCSQLIRTKNLKMPLKIYKNKKQNLRKIALSTEMYHLKKLFATFRIQE